MGCGPVLGARGVPGAVFGVGRGLWDALEPPGAGLHQAHSRLKKKLHKILLERSGDFQ